MRKSSQDGRKSQAPCTVILAAALSVFGSPFMIYCPMGGLEVRRGVYLLLAVFVVQLSGLRGVCAPQSRQMHGCCPSDAKTTPSRSSSLPDCCLASILNFQVSITEARQGDRPSEYTAQPATVFVASAAPLIAISTPVRFHVLPTSSPPLSPLSQSCVLLI
jgi:hypothetical protein